MKSRIDMLKPDEIHVDERYQRSFNETFAQKKIIDHYNPDALGIILVSHRANGKFYALDGQHRLLARRAMGKGDERIRCEVFEGLSLADEALLFDLRNTNHGVRAFEKFRARLIAGEPRAVEVAKIARQNGYEPSNSGFACVSACENVHAKSPKLLADTLALTRGAWGKDCIPTGHVVRGIAMLIERFNGELDLKVLQRKLAKRAGGQNKLIGDARSIYQMEGGGIWTAVAEVLRREYNKGHKEATKLPPIRKN